jgi:hypothetical protein
MPTKRQPRRKAFSLPAIRRREIERHARDVGAADTEDLWRWLVAWIWHNDQNVRDPVGALQLALDRMGGTITKDQAIAILEQADDMPQRRTADSLARFLGVTYPQRQRLGITTIGSVDVSRRARRLMRKRKKQHYKERKRREQGIRPLARCLSRIKPWEAEGMSRSTWYRKRLGTTTDPAIPTLRNRGTDGTTTDPAILSLGGSALVPTERKQEGAFGGGFVLENGVWLSRRWIAAREKACGCRHNRPLPADLSPAGGEGCSVSC